MPLVTHASPTSFPTLLNFFPDQNPAKSCKTYLCHHSSSSMHLCRLHHLSPPHHMPHPHLPLCCRHHCLPSNSLVHVQQSSFLSHPAFRLPLTTVAKHHRPRPRVSASQRLVALVLSHHFCPQFLIRRPFRFSCPPT